MSGGKHLHKSHNETIPKCKCAEKPCATSIFAKRKRLIVSDTLVSKLSTLFGGGEGSRTPVRKTLLPTFYERICLFNLVSPDVKQHTSGKTSPLMRDEIQGYFSYTFTATRRHAPGRGTPGNDGCCT